MIVSHVWDAEYPWDVRVEKISRALIGTGHEVHILARNRDRRPATEVRPEGTVHRIPWITGLSRRVNGITQFPAFFNPRWVRLMDRTVRSTRSDVIVCRDLPLAPTAIHVAGRLGIPMVFDMAENYPAMIDDLWRTGKPRMFDRFVRSPRMARLVERWALAHADHVLVVVEESRQRVVELGVPQDRVTVVSNTPPLAQLAPRPQPRPKPSGAHLDLVYVGQIDAPMRGLHVVLTAVAECNRRGCSVRATLIGDGRERANLMALAAQLGLSPEIARFPGRLEHKEALAMLPSCDIGVVPHFANDHCDTTVPNKVFDYMAAGLAVIASDARPLARIVREAACGEVSESGDAAAMARAIERLADDDHRYRCSIGGWESVAATYHWERDVERLVGVLEAVPARRRVSQG